MADWVKIFVVGGTVAGLAGVGYWLYTKGKKFSRVVVEHGDKVGVKVTWKNNSGAEPDSVGETFAPEFRFDLHPNKRATWLPTWVEGPWTQADALAPGEQGVCEVWWNGIPGIDDWGPATGTVVGEFTIDAKLMVRLPDGLTKEIMRWKDAFLIKGTESFLF